MSGGGLLRTEHRECPVCGWAGETEVRHAGYHAYWTCEGCETEHSEEG